MNQSEFENTLITAYTKAIKYYGEDYAATAIESAIKLGYEAFETEKKLINYILSCAKGDKLDAQRANERRHVIERDVSRDYYSDPIQRDTTLHLDLATAIQGLDVDMRAAVEAHMVHGESLTSAIRYIEAKVSKNTKKYWLREVVDRIINEDLKDYKC